MNALFKLIQGSPEWHEHRSKYRNASETPAVMGVSPWQTPYDLWLVKTGRKVTVETEAMRHGTQMEPIARTAFETDTGIIMQPQVVVDDLYSASLDGITLAGDTLVEIKCPFRGQTSELWQTIKSGTVPEYYRLQVQHQLMVSKAKLAYLWVFDGRSGIRWLSNRMKLYSNGSGQRGVYSSLISTKTRHRRWVIRTRLFVMILHGSRQRRIILAGNL